jgi:hypothetical protein
MVSSDSLLRIYKHFLLPPRYTGYLHASSILISSHQYYLVPIAVAVRSKAWVYGRSLTGIMGSNPAGGMDVCIL